jgi:hypothetical protein
MTPAFRVILLGFAIGGHIVVAVAGAQVRPVHGDMPPNMRSVLGVRLNDDSLASTKARLGKVGEWHTGDAGESTWWWCYRVGTGSRGSAVVFSSDAEMGGDGRELDRIRVTFAERIGVDLGRCAGVTDTAAVRTPGGLQLGLSAAAVQGLLGAPLLARGDSLVYAWETEQPILPSHPAYAAWNARRTECFGGRAPYTSVSAEIVVRLDQRGVYEFVLSRGDNATC